MAEVRNEIQLFLANSDWEVAAADELRVELSPEKLGCPKEKELLLK